MADRVIPTTVASINAALKHGEQNNHGVYGSVDSTCGGEFGEFTTRLFAPVEEENGEIYAQSYHGRVKVNSAKI